MSTGPSQEESLTPRFLPCYCQFVHPIATNEPAEGIPEVVRGNNVTIMVPAGLYDQTLTVLANNVTLVGEAGSNCAAGDWTIIGGRVVITGNSATFRNISFEGPVEVRGNNARFIHCCFGGELVIFGNNTDIDDDDNEEG